VRIGIYAVNGRLVRLLAAEPLPQAVRLLHWDGRDEHGVAVANGAYFVRAESAGTQVQKLIVER
jgi:flagellar hook assembly protein FlgD